MSNSSQRSNQSSHAPPAPRAIIHTKILDAAESHPSASPSELAANISGASEELVERVFDEYGDPAEDGGSSSNTEQASESEDVDQTQSQAGNTPVGADEDSDPQDGSPNGHAPDLTEKQYETLQAIAANPEATQRELGEILDISGATVNSRVNNIDGFEWEKRAEFVSDVLKNHNMTTNESPQVPNSTRDRPDRIDEIATRVESIERRLQGGDDPDRIVITDPDLIHKIIHACISSEQISESEEIKVIKQFTCAGEKSDRMTQ